MHCFWCHKLGAHLFLSYLLNEKLIIEQIIRFLFRQFCLWFVFFTLFQIMIRVYSFVFASFSFRWLWNRAFRQLHEDLVCNVDYIYSSSNYIFISSTFCLSSPLIFLFVCSFFSLRSIFVRCFFLFVECSRSHLLEDIMNV